jgi:ariadne-2
LLQLSRWSAEDAIKKRSSKTLVSTLPQASTSTVQQQQQQQQPAQSSKFTFCDVCAVNQPTVDFSHLSCRHPFCKGCWEMHFECQIMQGISTSKKNTVFLDSNSNDLFIGVWEFYLSDLFSSLPKSIMLTE